MIIDHPEIALLIIAQAIQTNVAFIPIGHGRLKGCVVVGIVFKELLIAELVKPCGAGGEMVGRIGGVLNNARYIAVDHARFCLNAGFLEGTPTIVFIRHQRGRIVHPIVGVETSAGHQQARASIIHIITEVALRTVATYGCLHCLKGTSAEFVSLELSLRSSHPKRSIIGAADLFPRRAGSITREVVGMSSLTDIHLGSIGKDRFLSIGIKRGEDRCRKLTNREVPRSRRTLEGVEPRSRGIEKSARKRHQLEGRFAARRLPTRGIGGIVGEQAISQCPITRGKDCPIEDSRRTAVGSQDIRALHLPLLEVDDDNARTGGQRRPVARHIEGVELCCTVAAHFELRDVEDTAIVEEQVDIGVSIDQDEATLRGGIAHHTYGLIAEPC